MISESVMNSDPVLMEIRVGVVRGERFEREPALFAEVVVALVTILGKESVRLRGGDILGRTAEGDQGGGGER